MTLRGDVPDADDEGRLAALLDEADVGWTIERWGLDTVIFRFKLGNPLALASLAHPFAHGTTRGVVPGNVGTFFPDSGHPAEVTVRDSGTWLMNLGYAQISGYPDNGLVNVQARLAALLARDNADHSLAHPSRLAAGADAASELVRRALGGHPIDCDATVRRADLTTDLRNTRTGETASEHGENLLRALGLFHLARHAPKAHPGPKRRLEGVDWSTASKRKVFRVYDKGFEMGKPKHRISAPTVTGAPALAPHPMAQPAGMIERFERQWSPTSSKDYRSPTEFMALDLRSVFLGPWATWLRKNGSLVMCGEEAAAREIARKVAAGRLSATQGRTLLGHLGVLARGFEESFAKDGDVTAAADAARTALRAHGIHFAREVPRYARVRVGAVLALAASVWPHATPNGTGADDAPTAEPNQPTSETGSGAPSAQMNFGQFTSGDDTQNLASAGRRRAQ